VVVASKDPSLIIVPPIHNASEVIPQPDNLHLFTFKLAVVT